MKYFKLKKHAPGYHSGSEYHQSIFRLTPDWRLFWKSYKGWWFHRYVVKDDLDRDFDEISKADAFIEGI